MLSKSTILPSLICCVCLLGWVWDHHLLRAEMAAMRDMLESHPQTRVVRPGGHLVQRPVETLAGTTRTREPSSPSTDRLMQLIAAQLARGSKLIEFEVKSGVHTARINPLLAGINGLTETQISECETALAHARSSMDAINKSHSSPTAWERVESSGSKQVFRCVVKRDTCAECSAVEQQLSTTLKAALSNRQYELFAEPLRELVSGSRQQIKEVSFEVQADGTSIKESSCLYEGDPSQPSRERVTFMQNSTIHDSGLPRSYEELLRKVR